MQVRKANADDAESLAKVHVDSWRSTYKGIVPESFLRSLTYESRTETWNRTLNQSTPGIVFAAENSDGEIVGFISGGKERSGKYSFEGELYAIYIIEEYQGKGIGKKLFESFIDELGKSDIDSMLVWVLEDNKSRYFYEALGGKQIDRQPIEIGGAVLTEIAYGWNDLRPLRNRNP